MIRLKNIISSLLMVLIVIMGLITQGCEQSRTTVMADLRERQLKADSLMIQGDYQNAMKSYIDILRYNEHVDNDTILAKALKQIGTIYAYHDDYHKALSYYERSLDISKRCHDTIKIGDITHNLIIINKILGDKIKEQYYIKMFNDLKLTDNVDYNFNSLYIKFLNYIETGQDEKVKVMLKEMMAFIDKNSYGDYHKAILYNHLGIRYVEKEEYDSALNYYKQAANILDTAFYFSNRQAVYNNMCALFSQLGERDSLTYYRGKMYESSDSIFNLRNFNSVKERLDSYEQEMTEHKMEIFRKRVYWTSGIGAIILIILLIIVFYSKKINQARLVMVRLNETLLSENNNLRKDIENLTALRKNDEKAVAEVIEENLLEEREKTAAEPEKKMIISDELITRLSTQILEIMNDKHSVFNPDYSISMLALQLNTNTRYISEVIRHLGASNFRNFINEYRIREACRRLSDKEKYGKFTIGAIAESVGFNSDNSFIIAFKKVMGMTPAKYRRLASDVHKENNFQGNLDNL